MKYHTPNLEKCASVVRLGNTAFGNGCFGWIAGPCAVRSLEQMTACASA